MIFEGIGRVVGSAYNPYVEPSHEGLASELFGLELGAALVVDGSCCIRVEEVIYAEDPCELKVGPVVKRIPHCVRNSLCPLLEFLVTASRACDEFFRHSVPSHCSPLVVVPAKPYFCKILELVVIRDHLWNEVAVVVDDRHLFCALMIQLAGVIVGQHEVVIDERLFAHETVNVFLYF